MAPQTYSLRHVARATLVIRPAKQNQRDLKIGNKISYSMQSSGALTTALLSNGLEMGKGYNWSDCSFLLVVE